MEFRKGYTIKPAEVLGTGEIRFTDGTNDVIPNQNACEAYGYTYNTATATCNAFNYNSSLNRKFNNITNNTSGGSTESGTRNTLINGQESVTKGNNFNNIINGEKHQIENGINNSVVFGGSYGQVKNQGEVVIGGGGFNEALGLGLSQQSFVQQSNKTTDATETALLTQYLSTTYIQKVKNSIIGFEANVIGINYGGEGEVGEYGYVQLTGAVKFTNGLVSTYHQTSTHIVQAGHSGMNISAEMKDVTATSFGVHVTGIAGTRIQWTASVKLWQNQLQTTF
tara:strand:+ start:1432 stop:2274 length:843 start_codon:yes stop_codon:yes gene_type:complete